MQWGTGATVPRDCAFCEVTTGSMATAGGEVVAYRDSTVLALPSSHQRPTNRGHFLVVPTAHIGDSGRMPVAEHDQLLARVARVARAVRAAFGAAGVTVLQHNEYAGADHGGAHLYFHAVPRFCGDAFHHGEQRFPRGLELVSADERRWQAATLRRHLEGELVGAGHSPTVASSRATPSW